MALHGFVKAYVFMRSKPKGPVWLHVAILLVGSIVMGLGFIWIEERIGFWAGFASTIGTASLYYGAAHAGLNAYFGNDQAADDGES